MKNLFRPLLVLTGCIVLASCVSQKQFKGLKTDYTKLQKEYQESQLQLRENQARSTSLEERLAAVSYTHLIDVGDGSECCSFGALSAGYLFL